MGRFLLVASALLLTPSLGLAIKKVCLIF